MLIDLDFRKYEITKQVPKMVGDVQEIGADGTPVFENLPSGATIQIRPLEDFESYQKILAFLQEGNAAETDKIQAAMGKMQNDKWKEMLVDILPKHSRELTGMEIKKDGEIRPAIVSDLYTVGSLVPTAMQVFMQVFVISALPEEEKDGLKKQLPE